MFMPVARTVFQSQSMFGTFVAEPVVKETVQKEKRQRVKTQAVDKLNAPKNGLLINRYVLH